MYSTTGPIVSMGMFRGTSTCTFAGYMHKHDTSITLPKCYFKSVKHIARSSSRISPGTCAPSTSKLNRFLFLSLKFIPCISPGLQPPPSLDVRNYFTKPFVKFSFHIPFHVIPYSCPSHPIDNPQFHPPPILPSNLP